MKRTCTGKAGWMKKGDKGCSASAKYDTPDGPRCGHCLHRDLIDERISAADHDTAILATHGAAAVLERERKFRERGHRSSDYQRLR